MLEKYIKSPFPNPVIRIGDRKHALNIFSIPKFVFVYPVVKMMQEDEKIILKHHREEDF